MRLLEAIAKADAMRLNAIPEAVKAEWVFEVEGQVAEMMNIDAPVNTYPEDKTLLMPYPHDNFYPMYVAAMIDNYNEESNLFANDMAVANEAMQECFAWWWRHNEPRPAKYVRNL